ncbi:hypothetical protein ACEW7V_01020 [Areca yellow leaf disease phytoplasma]|uniref:hypothetical protein n=1 Tax=Areca yellow leaf disease phytoplasma TaxID=927614 RepID=UPI0035B50B27
MADYLYSQSKEDEGIMTKRASKRCERSLTIYAQNIELQNYLLLGKGEKTKILMLKVLWQILLKPYLVLFILI